MHNLCLGARGQESDAEESDPAPAVKRLTLPVHPALGSRRHPRHVVAKEESVKGIAWEGRNTLLGAL